MKLRLRLANKCVCCSTHAPPDEASDSDDSDKDGGREDGYEKMLFFRALKARDCITYTKILIGFLAMALGALLVKFLPWYQHLRF